MEPVDANDPNLSGVYFDEHSQAPVFPYHVVKQLGYGLRMSSEEVDSILNLDVFRHLHEPWDDYQTMIEAKHSLLAEEEGIYDDAFMSFAMDGNLTQKVNLRNAIQLHEPSDSNESFLLVTPPSYVDEWVRQGSMLDWAELASQEEAIALPPTRSIFNNQSVLPFINYSKFMEFDYNHYPISGYTNLVTDEEVKHHHIRALRGLLTVAKQQTSTQEATVALIQEFCSSKLRFTIDSPEQVWEYIIPRISTEVTQLLEWLNLFKDPWRIQDLRPALFINAETIPK